MPEDTGIAEGLVVRMTNGDWLVLFEVAPPDLRSSLLKAATSSFFFISHKMGVGVGSARSLKG